MYMGINLARKAEVAGAISDGLITTAHPAATAPTRGSSANTAKCVQSFKTNGQGATISLNAKISPNITLKS
jgi:hypothetical protein